MSKKVLVSLILILLLFYSCEESNKKLIDDGVELANKGKYREAIEKYSKVIRNNGKIQLAYYNRGLCYINTTEYLKALGDFGTILNLKTPGGSGFILEVNSEVPGSDDETKYQVSYDDGIYGRAQARYYLDSLESSYSDFQNLVDKNYRQKVICILFQSDIWHATGDDSTACEFAKRARKIAKTQGEIVDCDSTIMSYCGKTNDR